MQVLPVDPGSQVVHNSLLDLFLYPVVRLSLQLQRLVVILPLLTYKLKINYIFRGLYFGFPTICFFLTSFSARRHRKGKTHPLKVEEVFFEGLSGLSLLALVDDIGVFFVAAAFVIFAAMSLPVTKTHPAEVFKTRKHAINNRGAVQNASQSSKVVCHCGDRRCIKKIILTMFTLGTLLKETQRKEVRGVNESKIGKEQVMLT